MAFQAAQREPRGTKRFWAWALVLPLAGLATHLLYRRTRGRRGVEAASPAKSATVRPPEGGGRGADERRVAVAAGRGGREGERRPRDAAFWAKSTNVLRVSGVPDGAVNLNVEGRRVAGALQGFGQLWQKTYTVRLTGVTPAEVVEVWKREFPNFHPPQSRFYPSLEGVAPGEVMLINASVRGMPVYTGVMILYADEESFTVMTAEGLPEAGWNTFSAHEEDGETVVRIQSLARASDPIYEVGFRLFGSTEQEEIWTHVLASLAARFGCDEPVSVERVCVDPRLQWSQARNLWNNAGARSVLYTVSAPPALASCPVATVNESAAKDAGGPLESEP